MGKIKFISFVFVILTSCVQPKNPSFPCAIPKENPSEKITSKPFANPALFYGTGSSFGSYFQQLYRMDKFDEMVMFTSNSSRKKFGDDVLKGFYKSNFKFDFELGKLSCIQKSGDTLNLIYSNAIQFGTRKKIVMPILIESDSCKLLIFSLKNPFQLF